VPVFARSERNADRLDQMLVRSAAITPEQSQKSLEIQQKQPQKRVGQILLEMGAITLEQLHSTVKAQVQNLVLSLFTWADGKYMFEPGPLPTQEAITLDWDTPGAVLQGMRGLPLNYIRPLAPPKDAVIERAADTGILRELQLNSAEQKLLALLVGRHPMEQLLGLDFIANESLLRGLVTFAALGLITVQAKETDGETIELPAAPVEYVPKKVQPPTNEWPDPVPKKPKFVPGPATSAFDAEEDGVFQFSAPEEAPPEAPASGEDPFAAAQAALSRGGDAVPRGVYEALLAEKQELERRLWQLQEKMMLMLDELLRLRQQPGNGEDVESSNVRPFPGSKK
jgi:hypothetical protein